MTIALGMIIRNLEDESEVIRFIDNAEKYGHKLDGVIIAYTHRLDPNTAEALSRRLPFYSIDIKNPVYCREQFERRGISSKSTGTLLDCPVDTAQGLVPYGFKRTIVTMEAIMRGFDVLFFVDNDIYPQVLAMTEDGPVTEDTDFFGAHLEHLNNGAQVTTGEYSGYNILPPATFDGMGDLLSGLMKTEMLKYWINSGTHKCLTTQPQDCVPKPCTKILGGNSAFKLHAFSVLPPFFSSHYIVGDELFLCRGEDTILGHGIASSGTVCIDIGLNPLHDTYMSYPTEPDLRGDPAVQTRFYYACTGWAGRNPFLSYMRGARLDSVREFQREKLESGLAALAEYTSNPRFKSVINNFDVSWGSLNRYIHEYENVLSAWEEFKRKGELA